MMACLEVDDDDKSGDPTHDSEDVGDVPSGRFKVRLTEC